MRTKKIRRLEVPEALYPRLGYPVRGTSVYMMRGTEEDYGLWMIDVQRFWARLGIDDGFSCDPKDVSYYVHVSGSAVYKRLKEGRLTGFVFVFAAKGKSAYGNWQLARRGRWRIPLVEAQAWAAELGRDMSPEADKQRIADTFNVRPLPDREMMDPEVLKLARVKNRKWVAERFATIRRAQNGQ